MEPASRVTALFPNSVLGRLERMRVQTSRRFTAKSRGEHLSRRRGTSMEFADYRNYVAGDDVRYVDWNIFARLRRPYLKLFREEEEMHFLILLDASASMGFSGKLDRAKELAAAFGVMALLGGERVSVSVLGGAGGGEETRPCRLGGLAGRACMGNMFRFIEGIAGGGDAPVEAAIEDALRRHSGRGAALVLSDFLTFGDLGRAMNLLFGSGLELLALQVLAPEEIDPELEGDSRLVDSESGARLDVTAAGALVALYQEYRAAYEAELSAGCCRRGGRFLTTSSRDEFHWVLFDLLRRKGWIA
ncbi:MAG: DUF58 domain-containing protein [Planctomycetota bacterium]